MFVIGAFAIHAPEEGNKECKNRLVNHTMQMNGGTATSSADHTLRLFFFHLD
jgi:hypothetical protein